MPFDEIPSHPTWVRGLKPMVSVYNISATWVAPYVGAWIETLRSQLDLPFCSSHPTWVRGLKLGRDILTLAPILSHPTWVRGLKLYLLQFHIHKRVSHPTWVRGLKLANHERHYIIV